MIRLKPVSYDCIHDFEDTTYSEMSSDEKLHMIEDSIRKEHNGTYFELLAVCDDDRIVGFMNMYAHSAHIVSIGPEIKTSLQRSGYGFRGETQALQYAKDEGYTIAVAIVREDNLASIALHEKLEFEVGAHTISKSGNPVRIYVKNI